LLSDRFLELIEFRVLPFEFGFELPHAFGDVRFIRARGFD
jgi:hypothetical protein